MTDQQFQQLSELIQGIDARLTPIEKRLGKPKPQPTLAQLVFRSQAQAIEAHTKDYMNEQHYEFYFGLTQETVRKIKNAYRDGYAKGYEATLKPVPPSN